MQEEKQETYSSFIQICLGRSLNDAPEMLSVHWRALSAYKYMLKRRRERKLGIRTAGRRAGPRKIHLEGGAGMRDLFIENFLSDLLMAPPLGTAPINTVYPTACVIVPRLSLRGNLLPT